MRAYLERDSYRDKRAGFLGASLVATSLKDVENSMMRASSTQG